MQNGRRRTGVFGREKSSSPPVWKRLALVVLGLVLVVLGVRATARRLVFRAQGVREHEPPADVVAREVLARDGARAHAWELVGENDARIVVHFHNNRETALDALAFARSLRASGLGVVLVEYRGYGASVDDETPSEDGLYADAEAVLDMLAERGVGPERIVLSGISLGTGVAAEMARRGRGAGRVLSTPYTSIPDLVAERAPFLPVRLLVPDRFETSSKVDAIAMPTLVIHGDADEIVPFHMGADLAARLPSAQLVRVAGGHHGDLFAREGDRLIEAIVELAHR
jgi:uncharacterized protein